MRRALLIVCLSLIVWACGGEAAKREKSLPVAYTEEELATMSAERIAEIMGSYAEGMVKAHRVGNGELAAKYNQVGGEIHISLFVLWEESKLSDEKRATIYTSLEERTATLNLHSLADTLGWWLRP